MAEQTVAVSVNVEGKSVVVAYLLWWFLGGLGLHRFYLRHPKTAITQLLMLIIGIVTAFIIVGYFILAALAIWWLIDAFLTYQYVEEENKKLGVGNSTVSVTTSGGTHSDLEQLEKLHSLYEKGVITQEQYEARKATLI